MLLRKMTLMSYILLLEFMSINFINSKVIKYIILQEELLYMVVFMGWNFRMSLFAGVV